MESSGRDRVDAEAVFRLHTKEVLSDHVHRFVEAGPTFHVEKIVHRLEGVASRILRGEFPHLRSRLPALWDRSYYAGSVGTVSDAIVRRSIEARRGV